MNAPTPFDTDPRFAAWVAGAPEPAHVMTHAEYERLREEYERGEIASAQSAMPDDDTEVV